MELTICGLAGHVQIAVPASSTMAEVKAQGAEKLGLQSGGPDVPWELVLLEPEAGNELLDASTVETSGLSAGRQLVLVRRQKRLYTPKFASGTGCYMRREDGTFDSALPGYLRGNELVLRRLDNEEYPWLVNDFEVPNMRMGRFQVLRDDEAGRETDKTTPGVIRRLWGGFHGVRDDEAGREVYVNLLILKQITRQVKEQMSAICAVLGKADPFEDF